MDESCTKFVQIMLFGPEQTRLIQGQGSNWRGLFPPPQPSKPNILVEI